MEKKGINNVNIGIYETNVFYILSLDFVIFLYYSRNVMYGERWFERSVDLDGTVLLETWKPIMMIKPFGEK